MAEKIMAWGFILSCAVVLFSWLHQNSRNPMLREVLSGVGWTILAIAVAILFGHCLYIVTH